MRNRQRYGFGDKYVITPFKAKQQFYTFNLGSSRDAKYILEKYFDKNSLVLSGQIDYKTYQKQKVDILRKLNSHARYVRLRAGLFEYNKIFKSIHVLNLIDGIQFRKAIRTARNRTEAYHQLQGFIRKIYHGIFKGRKVMDNRVSAHAARLIANCIIAYNSTILNIVYQKMIREGVSQDIIDEFARISPIVWVHILFAGRYSFRGSTGNINVTEMAKIVEIHLKECFWKAA